MPQKRKDPTPPVEIRKFTLDEIDLGIKKLYRRIEEIKNLDLEPIQYDDAKVSNVAANIRDTILDIFGLNSPEFRKHKHHSIRHGSLNIMDSDSQSQAKFKAGILQTEVMLEGLISRLKEKREDLEGVRTDESSLLEPSKASRKVFIVHGHEESMKEAIARTLDKLDFEPIILHEMPNQGRTIIEKFTDYSDVGFACILLSPDDFGYSKSQTPESAKLRARQNVILELGFFLGKLGRERVLVLYKEEENFEMPSDYSGVLYTPYDSKQRWKFDLVQELKACGYDVDANKLV